MTRGVTGRVIISGESLFTATRPDPFRSKVENSLKTDYYLVYLANYINYSMIFNYSTQSKTF